MKKMIVAVVILALIVGGSIGNVSASWWGSVEVRIDNGVTVIGGNTQGSVDTSEKGIWDTYFPKPTPMRHRYQHWYEHTVPL